MEGHTKMLFCMAISVNSFFFFAYTYPVKKATQTEIYFLHLHKMHIGKSNGLKWHHTCGITH